MTVLVFKCLWMRRAVFSTFLCWHFCHHNKDQSLYTLLKGHYLPTRSLLNFFALRSWYKNTQGNKQPWTLKKPHWVLANSMIFKATALHRFSYEKAETFFIASSLVLLDRREGQERKNIVHSRQCILRVNVKTNRKILDSHTTTPRLWNAMLTIQT